MFGNTGDIITLGPENVRVLAIGDKEVPKVLRPHLDQIGGPPAHKEGIQWFAAIHRGLCTVPGTPKKRIEFICKKVDQIARTKEYAEGMDKAGLPAYYRPRKEYQEFIRNEKELMIGILEKLKYILLLLVFTPGNEGFTREVYFSIFIHSLNLNPYFISD